MVVEITIDSRTPSVVRDHGEFFTGVLVTP
jgi:hypothetical protein